jgi:hypothetical protein
MGDQGDPFPAAWPDESHKSSDLMTNKMNLFVKISVMDIKILLKAINES